MGGSISGAQDAVSFSEQNALPQKARRGTRIAKVRKTVGGNPLQANGQRKSFSLKIVECCVRTKAKKKVRQVISTKTQCQMQRREEQASLNQNLGQSKSTLQSREKLRDTLQITNRE